VVLTDGYGVSDGGTQTIAGLAVGASVTRTINWNTAGATLVGHTLFATQKLADNNPSNNSMAISVIVQAPLTTDLAVNSVTAPATVAQGSSAGVTVSVQNVGGLAVSSNFDVVLTDATAGVTIGTQTIAGLPAGSNTSRTFNWSTTGVALGGHTLVATQTLTDANAANNQRSVTVTVIAPSTDVAVTSMTAPADQQRQHGHDWRHRPECGRPERRELQCRSDRLHRGCDDRHADGHLPRGGRLDNALVQLEYGDGRSRRAYARGDPEPDGRQRRQQSALGDRERGAGTGGHRAGEHHRARFGDGW
jgi:hypothetical protein